jgi:hypothetical protein
MRCLFGFICVLALGIMPLVGCSENDGGGGSGGSAGSGGTGGAGGTVGVVSITYVKASNADSGDGFGAVSLSADGQTLAVGAKWEASAATGVNGDQSDNSGPSTGAVYVFDRSGDSWSQQAYLKGDELQAESSSFGMAVSLSADGNTLAVGSLVFGSDATVYVFTRTGSNWSQQARFDNAGRDDWLGNSVSLAAHGNTLAVGAFLDDRVASNSGAVYVFTRSGDSWTEEADLKASNPGVEDNFGHPVSLAADGNTLAVGARGEDSGATGVDSDQDDNSAQFAGAAYVFRRTSGTWAQEAYIKASDTAERDFFGTAVSLSGQGDALAVGAENRSGSMMGAAYVFTRSGSAWSQQSRLEASNADPGDLFGSNVSLSSDATNLAVGAAFESSSAVGLNGDQADNSVDRAGAVYLFRRNGSTWSQQAYLKASNTDEGDGFGGMDPLGIPTGLGLSGDGRTLAVGAFGEDSAATGVNNDQADNSAENSGAAYVYELE